jgi:putative hydrolase of the HAD superfamily
MEPLLDAVRAVGFDLDYTLWDQDAFARSFFDAISPELGRRLGCGPSQAARACEDALCSLTLAHPHLFDQVLHRLGAWDPRLVAELVERYHRHRPPAVPYPGAERTLGRLRQAGFRLFLVTDGYPPTQKYKVDALGLGPWFDQMVFTGELRSHQRKPSPFPFQLACGRLGVAPDRCVYVGDNAACDFAGPKRLGMFTIGVSTGPFAGMEADPGQAPHLLIGPLEDLDGLLSSADAVRGVL